MFNALFVFRRFIFESIKREFLSKYAKSVLGSMWAVINPLSMIVIYTLIFSQIMVARLPGQNSPFAYSIYLCAGVLPWGLFLEVSNKMVGMFVDNAGILKKVHIPKVCLPAIILGNAFINFAIISLLFVVFLFITGSFPGAVILFSIPLLALLLVIGVSIGIFLGTINVFFRDISQIYGILTQFWFWFTPMVYPASIVPEKFRIILSYNPLYPIINGFHLIFVEHKIPDFSALWPIAMCSIVLLVFSLYFLRKHSEEIVDEL